MLGEKGMIKFALVLLFCSSISVQAITYSEALEKIQEHEVIQSGNFKVRAIQEEAKSKGSWGDPVFKIAAKNYPIDTLANDQTPMTGIDFGVSQKIPLTNKYEVKESAFTSLSQAYKYNVENQKELLILNFWNILIENRKLSDELIILENNKDWIEKNLKVSSRLYAMGKATQQAILEIQIRSFELDNIISNKKYELSKIKEKLKYLTGYSEIEEKSIPWNSLDTSSTDNIDYRELEFQEKVKAKQHAITASSLDLISDITISLNYTQRSNIDMFGDFIGVSISFPLPFSDKKSSNYSKSLYEESKTLKEYEVYKKSKNRDIMLKIQEIKKLNSELNVLNNKIIGFAINARKIISKSYGVGKATYIELLQSELNLQNILLRKVALESKRDLQRVSLKYIKGELFNE